MKSLYKYFQPNRKDLKDNCGDCVIRALSKATGQSWVETFDDLVLYAREHQCLPNDKLAFSDYLKSIGYRYNSLPRGSRITVSEFCKSRKGLAICHVRVGFGTHLVTVDDGHYWDTWDCGNKFLYGYYEKD